MASEGSEHGSGNLELFLDDVYKTECMFQIEEKEITFIQTGIESLVEKIVQKVHKNISVKEFSGVKICEAEILKVGSFYEGTRNKFPDEFDFIYVFCECEQEQEGLDFVGQFRYLLDEEFDKSFQPACMLFQANHSLQYNNEGSMSGKKEILFCGDIQKHGPARLIPFVYHLPSGETKLIYVDLVPAVRLNDIQNYYAPPNKHWKDVKSLGKYLFVGSNISITEAEVYIMKNILSKKHIKVYRILKYLINGHGDDEALKKLLNTIRLKAIHSNGKEVVHEGTTWSSYMIKCTVIDHHYECRDNDTENVGACIIEVLGRMRDGYRGYSQQRIYIVRILARLLNLMTKYLENNPQFINVKNKTKSLSRECIDTLVLGGPL